MCGIAGIINLSNPVDNVQQTKSMITSLQHRGPDEFGIYSDKYACLGHARLSILDLATGSQPIPNEDKSRWIIYNGEVFNYPDLRETLIKKGHVFSTASDTEVILHGYEEYSINVLHHLNGQFAFAIWDLHKKYLFIARDRFGIRPLFYYHNKDKFIFASEIKAILPHIEIIPEIDPFSLSQIFTFWTTLYPRTIFKNIFELPPAHYLMVKDGAVNIQQYWNLSFPRKNEYEDRPFNYWSQQLQELLIDATIIRLRADVPVGAYLSGGLDSSIITAIIMNYTKNPMKTFSISFEDRDFDESNYQRMVRQHLGTQHKDRPISNGAVAANFPLTIWHTEKPILRTAPVPMMLLSRLVRENNFKVVLTGEGADEFLGGYNIFKENMVRLFWAKFPTSKLRPLLLQKLYPYLKVSSPQIRRFAEQFFAYKLTDIDHPAYSHLVRWRSYETFINFLSNNLRDQLKDYQPIDEFIQFLPSDINNWATLCKAQFIEIYLFMSGYLLSSQGDRMGMANAVEGRFPFLDHRLVEFCSRIPPKYKLNCLNEKYILKKTMGHLLPDKISKRAKQPYRAPVAKCFLPENDNKYVRQLMSPNNLNDYFNPIAVLRLIKKWENTGGNLTSERDNMAFIGILSTLLVHEIFISQKMIPIKQKPLQKIKIIRME